MTEGQHKQQGPKYTKHAKHNDFLMPFGFLEENFSTRLTYQPTEADAFVSTYPKCGTTWTQHIIYTILNHGVPLQADQRMNVYFPHLEEVGCDYVQKLPKTNGHFRLIKTHLPYDMTPMSSSAKYIYVTRNPKDCVVSFYFHTKGFINCYDYGDGTLDEYFELFFDGKVDFGDYFVNLKSWLRHRNDENVLFITYEDLVTDYRGGVLNIASFLGGRFKDMLLENNESMLQKVMEGCSFNHMQKDLLRWCSKREDKFTPFIRNGKVKDWENHLSKYQIKRLDQKLEKELGVDAIASLWPVFELQCD